MRRVQSSSGFTLVEVIVASAILAIVVLSLSTIFIGSFKNIIHTGSRVDVYYQLQSTVEQRMLDWQYESEDAYAGSDNITLTFGAITAPVDGQLLLVNENGEPDTDGFVIFVPNVR